MCTPDLQKRSQLVPNYLSCTGIILASWTYCEISSSLPSSGTWRIWQRQSLRMVKIRPMSREPLQCHSGKMMITESQQSHSTESLYITAEEVRLIRFRQRKDVLIGKIAFQACNHLVICAPVWHRQDLAGFCTYFLDIDFGYLSRICLAPNVSSCPHLTLSPVIIHGKTQDSAESGRNALTKSEKEVGNLQE